ncbi:hypothetical protein [Thermosipho sp. 1074]|uniref:hypothetical protein n=1 Tax=Thermosipho sp. 1074 TaxID=1643331 RepID=UPI000984B57B|nr:hypothetical protein [Thermosipho sp. 1074]OOC42164.1 hypothetical protein XO08_07720 [Thermosipho sp. 1074]
MLMSSNIKTKIPDYLLRGLLKLARKYGAIAYTKRGNYYLYPEKELKTFVKKLEAVVIGKDNTGK